MTVGEMIRETGHLPKHFVTSKGYEFKLEVTRRFEMPLNENPKDIITVSYWQYHKGVRVRLFAFKEAETEDRAIEKMKNYLMSEA